MTVSDDMLKAIGTIPPLSHSSRALIALVADPGHTVADVTRIVEADAALTMQVLKVVNSAAFGLSARISAVSRAVAYLGDKTTMGIALGLCASKVYNDPMQGYDGEKGQLWRHSIRTAITARELAEFTGGAVNPAEAYTAGLIHDIGKGIISDFIAGSAADIVRELDDEQFSDYREAEHARFGTDHSEVGSKLAAHWGLPSMLIEAISLHHMPARASEEFRVIVYVTHIADIWAMMGGAGTGADSMLYTLDPDFGDYVKIKAEDQDRLMPLIDAEFRKTAAAITDFGG